jgi:LysR family glycine cleavage system transcriptional activator
MHQQKSSAALLRLPPLNALRAFEAAARHSSFKRAAEELCVTPGAVSRHVAKLEAYLGTRLFHRHQAQVELTPAGSQYLDEIREAFARISRATASTRAVGLDERLLRIKVPPTCAARWLVPRLSHFHADHADVSIQINTSHEPADFANDEVDAAIHYGRGHDISLVEETLFGELLLPVCTAEVATQPAAVTAPRDLAQRVLLHSIRRPNDWPEWFAAAGVRDIPLEKTLAFENSTLTCQGAVDGLGVAIAQQAFVIDELEHGRLVAPVDFRLRGEASYRLVFPREKADCRKIRLFHRWIALEAARTREQLARPTPAVRN